MSFEKPNDGQITDDLECSEEPEQFFGEVADGLHALAQPLTILRSAIGMLNFSNGTGIDRQRYLELSERQMDRTCALFASLQNLLASKVEPVVRAEVNPTEMLTRIVDERSISMGDLGVGAVMALAEGLPLVYCDAERTEQAVYAALQTATLVCARGDVVEVGASQHDNWFEFTVRGLEEQRRRPDSSGRLYLSLAKANVLSQGGKFGLSENPFQVSLAVPVLKAGLPSGEAVACGVRGD